MRNWNRLKKLTCYSTVVIHFWGTPKQALANKKLTKNIKKGKSCLRRTEGKYPKAILYFPKIFKA
jgi:hypothetical protein